MAEKVERDVLVFPRPVIVLAVNDLGLRWMKLQTALCKATRMASSTNLACSSLLQWTIASSAKRSNGVVRESPLPSRVSNA